MKIKLTQTFYWNGKEYPPGTEFEPSKNYVSVDIDQFMGVNLNNNFVIVEDQKAAPSGSEGNNSLRGLIGQDVQKVTLEFK